MLLKFRTTVLLFFLVLLLAPPSVAQNSDDLEQMLRDSKTRAILVKNVQKAVVHIKVEKIMNISDGSPLNNPMELYNDEFFRRFFPELRPPKNQPPKKRQNPNREFRKEGMGSDSIINSKG